MTDNIYNGTDKHHNRQEGKHGYDYKFSPQGTDFFCIQLLVSLSATELIRAAPLTVYADFRTD